MNMAPAQPGSMNLQPPQAYPPTQDVMPGQGAPPPGAPDKNDMAKNPVMTAITTLTSFVSQLDPSIQQAFGKFIQSLMSAGGGNGQAPAPAAPAPAAGPMQEPPPPQAPMGAGAGQETMEQGMMRRGAKPMAQPVIM